MSALDRYVPELSERATRWLRFGFVVLAIVLLVWAAISLQQVLTPIVAAFAIAYILNPLVTWLEKRRRISRVLSVSVGVVFLILLGGILLFAGVLQLVEFTWNIPKYVADAQIWIDDFATRIQTHVRSLTATQLTPPARAPAPDVAVALASSQPVTTQPTLVSTKLASVARDYGASMAGAALRSLSDILSNAFHWISLIVLLPMYTFFLLVHFNDIVAAIRDHLPDAYRPAIIQVVSTIDSAISNFFRGRLMVCLGVGVCTAIGWTLVGFKYGFALGALAGLLNLVPFMSILVLPPALILTYTEAAANGQPWAWPVVAVFLVYLAVQAIESFVLSPVIESRTSGLHPVTVVVALLIGSQIAGLLGMLLAIPVASTLKSLGAIYVLPEIRRLAGRVEEKPPDAARPYPIEPSEALSDEPALVPVAPGKDAP